jgi:hypothetical protein
MCTYVVPMKDTSERVSKYHPAITIKQRPKRGLRISTGRKFRSNGFKLIPKDIIGTMVTY